MAGMIGAIVLLVFMLSRWMTKPVEEMRNTIVRIKNGESSLRVSPVGWSEELTVLGTEFNEMLDRIQAMAEEELQNKMLVERTEFKMFQAQINPHFLYNTLNTMSGIANAQNCPLVSGICHSLSAIFRYSLNMTDELSTIQNEMDHVRNYLYVMDVRMDLLKHLAETPLISPQYNIQCIKKGICLPPYICGKANAFSRYCFIQTGLSLCRTDNQLMTVSLPVPLWICLCLRKKHPGRNKNLSAVC